MVLRRECNKWFEHEYEAMRRRVVASFDVRYSFICHLDSSSSPTFCQQLLSCSLSVNYLSLEIMHSLGARRISSSFDVLTLH